MSSRVGAVVVGVGRQGQEALTAFTSFLDHAHDDPDVANLVLSSRVAHRWRRFVLCTVHLRFADCAEQQVEGSAAACPPARACAVGGCFACLP